MQSIRDSIQVLRHTQAQSKYVKKDIPCKCNQRRAGKALLITRKRKLEVKNCHQKKKRHCIIIKSSVQQENITIINIFAPNLRAPKKLTHTNNLLELINSVKFQDQLKHMQINDITLTTNCPKEKLRKQYHLSRKQNKILRS